MKRSVYFSGISCAILMLFGCIFKIMHWPGASVMLIVSVFLFCFWFLPTGLKNNYEQLPIKKMKTLHIVAFLVFAFCMMGALFKIMHWPGAAMFLLFGLILPFALFLPVYLYHTREEEKAGNNNFFSLILGLTFLAVFGAFLAMGISKQIIHQATTSVNINEATKQLVHAAQNESVVSQMADDLISYADELKCDLLKESDAEMCSGNNTNANYKVENILAVDQVKNTFSSEEGSLKIEVLKKKIDTFRETILSSKEVSPELSELTRSLFDTSDKDLNNNFIPGEWKRREIDNYPLVFMLDFLSKLQSNVRLVEAEALN